VALGRQQPVAIPAEFLESYLSSIQQQDSTMYIALHADQDIPYRDVVQVLDIANQHKMKIVIATKK
jgi:biopolymer transport protein ExbD